MRTSPPAAALAAAYESSPVALLCFDGSGRLRQGNPAALRLLGWERLPADLPLDALPVDGAAEALRELGSGSRGGLRIAGSVPGTAARGGAPAVRVTLSATRFGEGDAGDAGIVVSLERDPGPPAVPGTYAADEHAHRAEFLQRLQRMLHRAHTVIASEPFALLLVRVDAPGGAAALSADAPGWEILARLGQATRPWDRITQIGDRDFAILVHGVSSGSDALSVAARLHGVLAPAVAVRGADVLPLSSIGICLSDAIPDAQSMLECAEQAASLARRTGERQSAVHNPRVRLDPSRGGTLRDEMADALDAGQFHLVYQPLVDLTRGGVCGWEALVRWRHPLRGELPPRSFLDVAERAGLAERLDRWVIQTACRQLGAWTRAGMGEDAATLFVNVTAQSLASRGFAERVGELLRAEQVPVSRLCLELTEMSVMERPAATLDTLARLHDLGIRIALDDFGIGYSSLSTLRNYPIDIVKIDRTFFSGNAGTTGPNIVRAILTLARSFGFVVVAEGVGTREQIHSLRALGCSTVQGSIVARPMEPDVAVAFAQAYGRRAPVPVA